ncbi:porin [Bradyrhizobium erythrophlei]|uniref:porin n=1 Tax=Bradyrhizobium erythrophlei TaxID=1437360 RepID=UPI0009323DAB|nr:porin [Bradyrhizobium erythrophlei]
MAFHAAPAFADKLDEVLSRLEALEKRDSKLAAENAALKARLNKVETGKSAAPAVSPAVGAVIATRTPTPPPALEAPEIDKNGHGFLEHKKGNPLTFYTPGGEITGYGNIDISFDDTTKSLTNMNLNGASSPVGNFSWLPAISTNTSYLGVRGFQRIENFPLNFVYQLELGFDLSATPGLKQTNSQISDNVNGALFNRNTYIGFASPEFGALKIGKTTAPYENSTGGFNPFAGQIGDMRVIMGNTGGDNRVEFATRLEHSIWYESPTIGGFQFNALFSPGQNRSTISDNIAAGSTDCTGGNDPTSGGLFPNGCNDGAFSNAVSTNLSYTNGPFYATVAYERHFKVNRQSDVSGIYGVPGSSIPSVTTAQLTSCPPGSTTCVGFANATQLAAFNADVADEDAFKVAALYTFTTKTTVGGIFEMMHRYVNPLISFQNERQRNGTWAFLTQELTPVDSVSFGWAHAFKAVGDPGQHNSVASATVVVPGLFDSNGNPVAAASNDNSADMITANYKHKFGSNLTWYTAVAATINGPNAHYDLGAGGRGVTTDCHDAFGASGGLVSQPHCFVGPVLAGVSTGIQWRF